MAVLSEKDATAIAMKKIGQELIVSFGGSFMTPANIIHKERFSQSFTFMTVGLTHIFYKRGASYCNHSHLLTSASCISLSIQDMTFVSYKCTRVYKNAKVLLYIREV